MFYVHLENKMQWNYKIIMKICVKNPIPSRRFTHNKPFVKLNFKKY